MTFKVFFIRLHKWTALIVGIQLVLWVGGGLVMSVADIDEVRGDLTKAAVEPRPLQLDDVVSIDSIVRGLRAPVAELALSTGFSGPQYRLTDTRGGVHHFDARTGRPLRAVQSTEAVRIAQAHYSGEGTALAPALLNENSTEYRGRLPVWRVDFEDAAATTLYIAADNGEVVTRRNRLWRIYDVAWMLHIMDYREREDFNHPLLVWASALAVLVALSGLYLVFVTAWRREFEAVVNRD